MLVAVAALATPSWSLADPHSWMVNSGWWDNPTNWSPAGPPHASDDAYIEKTLGTGSTIDVWYYNLTGAENKLNMLQIDTSGGGEVQLQMTAFNHTLWAGEERIGFNGNGRVVQSTGTNLTDYLYLGYNATGNGRYDLSGGTLNSTLTRVGFYGTGRLFQTGGYFSGTTLDVAYNPGSRGFYQISGGSLSAGTVRIGFDNNAYGTFTQSGASRVSLSGNLLLAGWHSGSQGTYELNGGTLGAGTALVGLTGRGIFNQTGGVASFDSMEIGIGSQSFGTLSLSAGSLNVSGTTSIGSAAGGQGTLTLSGTGMFNAGSHTTIAAQGRLNLTGGTLNLGGNLSINGGHFKKSGGAFVLAPGRKIDVLNSGSAAITGAYILPPNTGILVSSGTFSTTSYLDVGRDGIGTAIVNGAGARISGGGTNWWGSGSAGAATVEFHNGGVGTFDATVLGRNLGAGTLIVASGSSLTLGNFSAGTGGGTATINLSGSSTVVLSDASTFDLGVGGTATLNVSGNAWFSSGAGTTTIGSGGRVFVTDGGFYVFRGPLEIDGGVWAVTHPGGWSGFSGPYRVKNGGILSMPTGMAMLADTGTVSVESAGLFNLGSSMLEIAAPWNVNIDGGRINAGTIQTSVGTLNFTSGTLNITGSAGLTFGPGLVLGSSFTLPPDRTLIVNNATTIPAGGQLTLSGGTFESLGDLNVNGGHFTRSSGTFLLGSGRTINVTGGGTVSYSGAFQSLQGSGGIYVNNGRFITTDWIDIAGWDQASVGTLVVDGANSVVTAGAGLTDPGFWGVSDYGYGYGGPKTATVTISNGGAGTFGNTFVGGKLGEGTLAGSGTVNVLSGGSLTLGNFRAGFGGGTAVINLSGSTSRITLDGASTFSLGQGGVGTLNLSGGTFSSGTGTTTIFSGGTVHMNSGTYSQNGPLVIDGGTWTWGPSGWTWWLGSVDLPLTVKNGGVLSTPSFATVGGLKVSLQSGGLLDLNAGAGTLQISGTGSLDIAGGRVNAGNTLVRDGRQIHYTSGTFSAGNLQLNSGGRIVLSAGGNKTVQSKSLSIDIASGSRLDLANNRMIIDYTGASPAATLRGYIQSGYAGGAWNGPGVMSSSADPSGRALGYAEASAIFTSFPATFFGHSVDNTSLLVRYTRYGDANLDGVVNLADFNRLAANFGLSGRHWWQGDFNYDGIINLNDFNRLAANFGLSASGAEVTPQDWAALAAVVPEPGSAALLTLVALPLVARRYRRVTSLGGATPIPI